MNLAVPLLHPAPDFRFPDPAACTHPEGLVAMGGDLERGRLLEAYRQGIFPWYEAGGPILWWSPNPRAVLQPDRFHLPKRLGRTLRQQRHQLTIDQDFDAVIRACADLRAGAEGTWITPEMHRAYLDLHHAGFAHSVEIRHQGQLSGGLYGVALGKVFFAESKFHVRRDASKLALAELMRLLADRGFTLCDCQLWNRHLQQFGVRLVERHRFLARIHEDVRARNAWPGI